MPKFRYISFKRQRRREQAEDERAYKRAEKDFQSGKTVKNNPYRGVRQKYAWLRKFEELLTQ